MAEVGLSPKALELYPHEFSGGQRQRIGLARALALDPKLIVADEPVSALDVSIQAQILNLLKELQQRRHLTYIFISHDLAVVKYMADTIGVMYLGKLVEVGPALEIYDRAAHPYTRALIDTIPEPEPHAGACHPGQAHHRGAALRHATALGVPLPDPVPLRPGGVRRGGAAAATVRRPPLRCVPLPPAGAHGVPTFEPRGGHGRLRAGGRRAPMKLARGAAAMRSGLGPFSRVISTLIDRRQACDPDWAARP